MRTSIGLLSVVTGLAMFAGACDLLNTADSEQSVGRGAIAHDPYLSSKSGAIKLALQQYNGCAIHPSGDPAGAGSGTFGYPTECESYNAFPGMLVPAGPPLQMLVDSPYFLDRFTLAHVVNELHTDPTDKFAPLRWVQQESLFKSLDWSNAMVMDDRFSRTSEVEYDRTVHYGNSAWQLDRDQTLTLEVLDSAGVPRTTPVVYSRRDFLVESDRSGHTKLQWRTKGLARPLGPEDTLPVGSMPSFQTAVRIEFFASLDPFSNVFNVPRSLAGQDGAIRVTWSAMPDQPFLFPTRFLTGNDVAPTCFAAGADGGSQPCSFGIDPELSLTPPANGEFYQAGETFRFLVGLKDDQGAYLHPVDRLPSQAAFRSNTSNGLLFFNPYNEDQYLERDSVTTFKVAGPLQDMRVLSGNNVAYDYFRFPSEPFFIPSLFPGLEALPGGMDYEPATQYSVTLPEDAKPGTYEIMVKSHRAFLGERFSKMETFFFQVGQREKTTFPGRVGNCQICHRGVISLENLRHGESVNNIEGCKGCHTEAFGAGDIIPTLHQIHFGSNIYPFPKNDCTVCHLTRESATRANVAVCSSCHREPHNNEYFDLSLEPVTNQPNARSTCATACHVVNVPTGHRLPPP